MALTVATNTGALMAQAAASSVNKEMEISMERLATGKRINGAADDAAGVAIASRLTSEIRGTNQAIRNAMDGQALIDTAEGAHVEIENILQRMRELSVQARNDTNNADDRNNLQAELNALTAEIDRIAGVTAWAGQKLLTGSGGVNSNGTFGIQVGSQTASADNISTSISAVTAAALGVGAGNSAVGANAGAVTTVGSNNIQFSGTPAVGDVYSMSLNGETVSVEVAAVSGSDFTYKLNGGGSVTAASGAANTPTASKGQGVEAIADAMRAAVEAIGQPGIVVTSATDGSVTVTQPIVLSSLATDTTGGSWAVAADGKSATLTFGTLADSKNHDFTVNGVAIEVDTASGDAYDNTQDGLKSQMEAALAAAASGMEGLTAVVTKVSTTGLKVDFATSAVSISNVVANPANTTTALSLTSSTDAKNAITAIDAAIKTVNTQRANLGAVSNRLDSTVSNLTNISSNLQAGRGRIEDADFAAETTSLAKSQILQQASTAMLAQANASKQNVLSLLQG